ncbi:MAG: hypothetical protein KZQ80_14590 [Candidatus Thiodiazotropha sp. (ex Monitilora ramsayi)]|nr:hypothetical protein [Candidatus Thiodiazotropha sp. (ex Monitilora ramsayi)]
MSNSRLLGRIENALDEYKSGKIDRKTLISSITENGKALEMMPYNLIKEIDEIEYQFTVSQFSDEEECLPSEAEVIARLSRWLSEVPRES